MEEKIGISQGDDTELVLSDVLGGLDPIYLDELIIERDLEASSGLAGEPITVGAVIAGGTVAISAFLRLLERHLEHRQQRAVLQLVAEGFQKKQKLGEELAIIAKKYADVSIKYGIAREAWSKTAK